jgi:hypothetical protein
VSVSIGSSKRNHVVEVKILGETVRIERIGTDGDVKLAIDMIKRLDGHVDAFGLGGIDLYVRAGKHRYLLREAASIARAAKVTPVVDGGGLKDTLERRVVKYLVEEDVLPLKGRRVLLVSGADRFGMAEALMAQGADLVLGDLIFVLGLPIPMRSLQTLETLARLVAPLVVQLPSSMIYPTGKKQEGERRVPEKFAHFYRQAEIIAGDFHYVKRYMPENMHGKVILTNTVTSDDVADLKRRGVRMLVTTTPEFQGRSFGTNVMEAVLVALSDKPYSGELTAEDYIGLLEKLEFKPRVETLN